MRVFEDPIIEVMLIDVVDKVTTEDISDPFVAPIIPEPDENGSPIL